MNYKCKKCGTELKRSEHTPTSYRCKNKECNELYDISELNHKDYSNAFGNGGIVSTERETSIGHAAAKIAGNLYYPPPPPPPVFQSPAPRGYSTIAKAELEMKRDWLNRSLELASTPLTSTSSIQRFRHKRYYNVQLDLDYSSDNLLRGAVAQLRITHSQNYYQLFDELNDRGLQALIDVLNIDSLMSIYRIP